MRNLNEWRVDRLRRSGIVCVGARIQFQARVLKLYIPTDTLVDRCYDVDVWISKMVCTVPFLDVL